MLLIKLEFQAFPSLPDHLLNEAGLEVEGARWARLLRKEVEGDGAIWRVPRPCVARVDEEGSVDQFGNGIIIITKIKKRHESATRDIQGALLPNTPYGAEVANIDLEKLNTSLVHHGPSWHEACSHRRPEIIELGNRA
mmetsp:Transcript_29449/g.84272  ORF Transcript_29449/g.84272 Transcript_29449/m.84272 type:complete len:138 (+) Transcript_29449:305-718(+)